LRKAVLNRPRRHGRDTAGGRGEYDHDADGFIQVSFIPQDYYVRECADNFVMHVLVADVDGWWKHIEALDLPARYGVRTQAPRQESWGLVANVTDPSAVLWRFSQARGLGDVEG